MSSLVVSVVRLATVGFTGDGVGRKDRARGGPRSRGEGAGRWCGRLVGLDFDVGFDTGFDVIFAIDLAIGFVVGFAVGFAVGFKFDLDVSFGVDFEVGFEVSFDVGFDVGLDVEFDFVFVFGIADLEDTSRRLEGISSGMEVGMGCGASSAAWRTIGRRAGGIARRLAMARGDIIACEMQLFHVGGSRGCGVVVGVCLVMVSRKCCQRIISPVTTSCRQSAGIVGVGLGRQNSNPRQMQFSEVRLH